MVLPLVFSYSATIFLKEASSSRTKPWTHHTVAVLPAASAMNGRPSVPAAASPADPRRTERLLSSLMLNPAVICSLAGEIISPDHRGCSVIEARLSQGICDLARLQEWQAGMATPPGTAGRRGSPSATLRR